VGYLELAKKDPGEIRVMDGHHRVLGIYLAYELLVTKRQKLREMMLAAERNGEPATVAHFKAQFDRVEAKLHQLSSDTVTLNLHIVNDRKKFEQIFVDVNDNALGVKKSLQAGFHSRKVTHRALPAIVDHRLTPARHASRPDC
jgi:hypothetical protein